MQVSIFLVRVLVEELEGRGVDAASFCASVDLPDGALRDSAARIDLAHDNRVIRRALAVMRIRCSASPSDRVRPRSPPLSFYRAFRRWRGVTPAEFQRDARKREVDELVS